MAGIKEISVQMVSLEDPEIAAEFFGKVNLGGDGKRDATVAPKKQEASSAEGSSGNVNRRPPSPSFWAKPSSGKLEESPEFSYDEPNYPPGSAGASKTWTVKARLKAAQLPNEGKIRFIPPDNYKPTMPLPKAPNGIGYPDKFGNIWKKGPSRTKGQLFEWDVQLSKAGQLQFKWLKENLSHLNVSLDGRITHLSK